MEDSKVDMEHQFVRSATAHNSTKFKLMNVKEWEFAQKYFAAEYMVVFCLLFIVVDKDGFMLLKE